jgi:muconolactone delta-isomerase
LSAGRNRFLVHGVFIDPGALLDADISRENSITKVLPSQERLAAFERAGTIVAGGVFAGAREVVFLADVDTNDELSALITSLPFWGLLKWRVQPLQTFETRAALSRRIYCAPDEEAESNAAKSRQ